MINSQTTKNLYRGNGSTLSYPVTYPFYEAENLLVLVAVGEVEETLSLGADYSVAINTDGSGGTVTFTSAERVPAGCTIAIMLNMALVQELDLSAVSHIDTESLEQELDKQVQYIQQMSEGLSRAVKTNATSEISPDRLVSSLFAARDESVAAKNAAETAQASAEAAQNATEAVESSVLESVATATTAVNDAGAAQIASVNSAGAAQVSSIQSEGATQVNSVTSAGTTQKTEMQSLVNAASGYAELAHSYAQQASPEGVVHITGDETITGAKTFTEKLFLAPKEDDRWLRTYIYGAENTLSLKIQNRTIDSITDSTGYPARGSLTLEGYDSGQGRFTLKAQSKYNTTNKRYYQYQLEGTSDGALTWTGGDYSSLGKIEIVDSSKTTQSYDSSQLSQEYIRYSSGLQLCWGMIKLNGAISSSNLKVTFLQPFLCQPRVLSCSNANNGISTVIVGWENTTYFTIGSASGVSANGNVNWLAIGPWK